MVDDAWIVPPPASAIDGSDRFIGMDATVADFWRFAMSDLRMNNPRGYLAEYLVAKAFGLRDVTRVEWDAYDLSLDGIRVEVKSSAYLQAWEQPRLSRIVFSGLRGTRYHPRYGYDPSGKRLNAHVYVFCVQTAITHEDYQPLDLNQWPFYILPRSVLEGLGSSSIGLDAVTRLSNGTTQWSGLKAAVLQAADGEVFDVSNWWA